MSADLGIGATIDLGQTVESFPRWLGKSACTLLDLEIRLAARAELGNAYRISFFSSVIGITILVLVLLFIRGRHAQVLENSAKPFIEFVELGKHVVLTAFEISKQQPGFGLCNLLLFC